jgi:CheY-like chemotaxis protein
LNRRRSARGRGITTRGNTRKNTSETNQSARILIVDDNLQNIQILGTVLWEKGDQFNFAQTGKKALDIAQKVLPNLILLGKGLPCQTR